MEFLLKHRMFIVKDPLIKLIGVDRFEKLTHTKKYRFLVEAFAMNVFSIVITTPNELLLAGMDFEEFVGTRLTAMVFNILTGRPWGLGSNGTENRFKDLDRELDDHVPGVLRLVQHTDIR